MKPRKLLPLVTFAAAAACNPAHSPEPRAPRISIETAASEATESTDGRGLTDSAWVQVNASGNNVSVVRSTPEIMKDTDGVTRPDLAHLTITNPGYIVFKSPGTSMLFGGDECRFNGAPLPSISFKVNDSFSITRGGVVVDENKTVETPTIVTIDGQATKLTKGGIEGCRLTTP